MRPFHHHEQITTPPATCSFLQTPNNLCHVALYTPISYFRKKLKSQDNGSVNVSVSENFCFFNLKYNATIYRCHARRDTITTDSYHSQAQAPQRAKMIKSNKTGYSDSSSQSSSHTKHNNEV
jgi:hypothetical protein